MNNMALSKGLLETCKRTKTSVEGMEKLVEYYIRSLGWSEKKANEYALTLFEDGTIEKIKVIGGKKRKDGSKN